MAANTGTIPYTIRGSGEKALVYLHGFFDEGKIWDPVIERVAVPGYASVTLDLPGMGALSDWEGDFSLRSIADEVSKVVRELSKPVVVIGQSMGTQIAELVAWDLPEQVIGICMVTPIPLAGLPVPPEVREIMLSQGGNEMVLRQGRIQMIPGATDEALDDMVETAMKVKPSSAKAIFEAWSSGDPAGKSEQAPEVPALMIVGSVDPFAPPDLVNGYIAPRYKKVTVEVLDGICHWAHVQSPEKVADLISRFVAAL